LADHRQIPQPAAVDNGAGLSGAGLHDEISELARLGCMAAGARGCLVAYRSPLSEGSVWATGTGPPRLLPGAQVWELAVRWADGAGGGQSVIHQVAPSDRAVARSLGIEIEDSAALTSWRYREGQSTISVTLVSAAPGAMTKAVAELTARYTSALIAGRHYLHQALFWRTQAGDLRDNLVAVRTQAARVKDEHARELAANRRLIVAAERGNLSAVARELSRLGPFEGWIIATQDKGGMRIRAVHGIPRKVIGEPAADLRHALLRRTVTGRNLANAAALSAAERMFRNVGYRAYLCVPLEGAALVLLSNGPLRAAARARVANRCRMIAPLLRSLFLGQELERQRALVRNLVRGLFATADAERASFRRDLHDDWAQLLAAAQIALGGDSEHARRFFRQMEGEMRKRLDALRPPQPRGNNVKATLAGELQRLRAAGIEATSSAHGLSRLPATIKEVLMRVIAEGVSNVIRHAGADRTHIEVECKDGVALAAVTDNGCGVNGSKAGSGLRGLAERVSIMGGSCKLDSKPGATRLSGWIPVANL
jgi:signal transduction histidine kinase